MGNPFVQAGAKKHPNAPVRGPHPYFVTGADGVDRPVFSNNWLWFFGGSPKVPESVPSMEEAYRAHFAKDPFYVTVPEIVAGSPSAQPWPSYPTAITPDQTRASRNRALGIAGFVAAATVAVMVLGSKSSP